MVKKRSLTILVTKTLSGDIVDGYPHTYYGLQTFSYAGTEYPAINTEQLSVLGVTAYETRLSAFISYVEQQEAGLVIADVQTNEPYF